LRLLQNPPVKLRFDIVEVLLTGDSALEQKTSLWYTGAAFQKGQIMQSRLRQLAAAFFMSCVINTSATVLYVDLNS
jgi:hypothetical protein